MSFAQIRVAGQIPLALHPSKACFCAKKKIPDAIQVASGIFCEMKRMRSGNAD